MVRVKDIPDNTRWTIATRVLTRLVVLVGNDPEEDETGASLQSRIFSEMGQEIRDIADRYGMPRDHAADLVQTLGAISVILFGPEFETRYIEGFPEESVIRLTGCAMFREESARGVQPVRVESVCRAYVQQVIEALNPAFKITVTGARCLKDPFCEMVIERKNAKTYPN